jgi:excisionase family DNA binding protein
MTTKELCESLDISRETLQRWLAAGLLGSSASASDWRGGERVWNSEQVAAVQAVLMRPRARNSKCAS